MSAEGPRETRLAKRWLPVVGAALLVLIVGIVLTLRDDPGSPILPSGPSASPIPTDQGLIVRENLEAVVPATVRTAAGEFAVESGSSYLLEFEISVTKLADTPGAEMYLNFSLNCSGGEGGVSESVGGTQNFITGELSTVRNQMLLKPSGDGAVACNVLVTSPNPEAAAAGATFVADIQWRMTTVEGIALRGGGDGRLPRAVDSGDREVVLSSMVDIGQLNDISFDLLVGLHMTTCSTVSGSRENGKYWCNDATTDESGSEYDLVLRADMVRDNGTPCNELSVSSITDHLDRNRHHQLVSMRDSASVPSDNCGEMLRITVVVDNKGPAPLVIHGEASSLLIVQAS